MLVLACLHCNGPSGARIRGILTHMVDEFSMVRDAGDCVIVSGGEYIAPLGKRIGRSSGFRPHGRSSGLGPHAADRRLSVKRMSAYRIATMTTAAPAKWGRCALIQSVELLPSVAPR